MTSRYVHPTGLWVYAGTGAVSSPVESVATLRRCGAALSIAMIQGITPSGDQRLPSATVARYVQACRDSAIDVILCAFPSVALGEAHLLESRDHLADLSERLHCRPQLDAEPDEDQDGELVHWTTGLVGLYLHIEGLSITTTAAEAPHVGKHDRLTLGQLEQPDSFAALERKLEIFERYSAPEDIVLVGGAFDVGRTVRTGAMMRRDQVRAMAQYRRSGAYACWDVRALAKSAERCDALREMALAA